MLNSELWPRIEELLKTADEGKPMSERKASLKAGLSADAVRNIRRFPDSEADGKTVIALATKALNCAPAYLLGISGIRKSQDDELESGATIFQKYGGGSGARRIPLVTWTEAAHPMIALRKYAEGTFDTVSTEVESDSLLATKIVGNAMAAIGGDGAQVVFDYNDTDLADRNLYLFRYHGELFFRRYRSDSDGDRFEADPKNDLYQDIPYNSDAPIVVVGRVRQVNNFY